MNERRTARAGGIGIDSAEGMRALGARLGGLLAAGDVVVLTGPLGAGKTTLVRGIGEALGVRGTVQSPTFVIARTHPPLGDGPPLVHVDAYRLGSALELDDLDLDLDASVTVIEWGREVVGAIADSWLELVIERATDPGGPAGDPDAQRDEPRALELLATGDRWLDAAGRPRPELAALLA